MNKVNRVVTRVRGSDGWREEEEEDNNEGVQPKPEHVAAGTVGCRCRCSSSRYIFYFVQFLHTSPPGLAEVRPHIDC